MSKKIDKEAMGEAATRLARRVGLHEGGLSSSDQRCRDVEKSSLGMSRLSSAKYDAVVALAKDSFGLRQVGGVFLAETPREDSPQEAQARKAEKTQGARQAKKPPPPKDRPKAHLGRVLESRLNERTRELPDGSEAAELFCHCPNCGTALVLGGQITPL